MRTLEALELDTRSGETRATGVEVQLLVTEVRRTRRALGTIAARSACGNTARAAASAIKHDPLDCGGDRGALGLDGFALRSLTDLAQSGQAASTRVAGISARELLALVTEIRRLRRTVHAMAALAARCPRTRAYAQRVLAKNTWAGGGDPATYPPLPTPPR